MQHGGQELLYRKETFYNIAFQVLIIYSHPGR
jgi:hypothetical protein